MAIFGKDITSHVTHPNSFGECPREIIFGIVVNKASVYIQLFSCLEISIESNRVNIGFILSGFTDRTKLVRSYCVRSAMVPTNASTVFCILVVECI